MSPNFSSPEFPCWWLFLLALLLLPSLLSFLVPQGPLSTNWFFFPVRCVKRTTAARPVCLKPQLFKITYILSPGTTSQRFAPGRIISLNAVLLFTLPASQQLRIASKVSRWNGLQIIQGIIKREKKITYDISKDKMRNYKTKQNKKQYQNRIRRAGAQSAAHAKRTVDNNTSMWEWQQCLLPTVLINRAVKQTENSLRLLLWVQAHTHPYTNTCSLSHLHTNTHTYTHCFYQANNPGN